MFTLHCFGMASTESPSKPQEEADTSAPPPLATNDHIGLSGPGQAPIALTGQTANFQLIPGYPQSPVGYHPYHPPYYNPSIPPPAYVYSMYMSPHAPGPAVPSAAPPDTTGTISRNVSLDEFCSQYEISESDKAKLKKLGYEPGNREVELLEEEYWRDFASFTRLGWWSFLSAHHEFRRAICSHDA